MLDITSFDDRSHRIRLILYTISEDTGGSGRTNRRPVYPDYSLHGEAEGGPGEEEYEIVGVEECLLGDRMVEFIETLVRLEEKTFDGGFGLVADLLITLREGCRPLERHENRKLWHFYEVLLALVPGKLETLARDLFERPHRVSRG